jgi:transcriptional regulator with XRE-family HTH domain
VHTRNLFPDDYNNRMGIPALPFSAMAYRVPKPKGDKYPRQLLTIGDHIRKRRMDLGLLQSDVSKIIGTKSIDAVRNWELGKEQPQIHHMPEVIKFLGYIPIQISLITLGDRIKTFRILKGLGHKAMGEQLNVNGSTIGSWEKNEFLPHKEKFLELNQLLEITFSFYAEILK